MASRERRGRRLAAAAVTVLFLTAASPALAISASVDEFSARTIDHHKRVRLHKAHNNGAIGKAQYKRKSTPSSVRNLWIKRDHASHITSGSGSRIFTLQVCHHKNNWPDDCSGWKN
ncbi:hypothetical protein [Streptomyces zingiberis]|uniref:Uncharacterized protein n=1 Tax=Streptomyces zingiberis TaxID=2053010 RepID=A0ABX1BSA8_9ACTN|nr:hypothetical protein [Streptomyces zingiberis]NJP99337.1 hypothetical protein [Streptomyces zingiberis]